MQLLSFQGASMFFCHAEIGKKIYLAVVTKGKYIPMKKLIIINLRLCSLTAAL